MKDQTLDADSGFQLFARRLRSLRIHAGHNQSQVAAFIGASKSQYSRYEQGLCDVPTRHLRSLCRLYGVSADYVLGLNEAEQAAESWDSNQYSASPSLPAAGSLNHMASPGRSTFDAGLQAIYADAANRLSNVHPAARRY